MAAARAAGDVVSEARALRLIGECQRGLGHYGRAMDSLGAALATARAAGDRLEEGKARSQLGLVYWERGDFRQAEAQFRRVIAAARELGHRQLEASALNNLSLVLDERGRYDESLAGYERALDLYAKDPLPRGESDTLSNIGGVHLLLGRYDKALEYYRKVLDIDTAIGSAPAIGRGHGNIGQALQGLGEFARADAELQLAIEAARAAGEPGSEAFWLKVRAGVQYNLGNYDASLELHRAALDRYAGSGARAEELEAHADFGELLLHLGDLGGAEAQFGQALATAREIDLHRGETQALLRLGDLQLYRHQHADALIRYRGALARAESVEDRARTAEALARIAEAQTSLDSPGDAAASATRSLQIAESARQPWIAAHARLQLALARERGVDPRDASALFRQALADAEALGDPDLLWRAHFGLGRSQAASGERTAAIRSLQAAVAVIEGVRSRLQQPRYRSGYLDDKYEVYVELVRLLVDAGESGQAFSVSEDLRVHTLQTMPISAPGPLGDVAQLAGREAALRARVRALQDTLQAEQLRSAHERRQSAVEVYSRELVQAERAYAELLDDAHANRRLSALRVDEQRLRAALGPDEAVLAYVVGAGGVTAFLLRTDRLRALQIPLQRKDLRAKIELLRGLVLDSASTAWRMPARSLYEHLLEPLVAQGWLDGISKLVVVPDGELNYLPFALLPGRASIDARVLVQDFVISMLPSASALELRAKGGAPATARLLALAPAAARLRHADAEVRAIVDARGGGAEAWTGAAASEHRFKQVASGFGLLHLATHGEFNSLNPAFSALELEPGNGEDGKLQVHEILRLHIDARLVTLSACNTALGSGYFSDIPVGNEFVGLTSAFLQAGSRAVLSSLWAVDDRFTSRFMVELYTAAEEADFAGGLAAAQRRILAEGGRYAHPFYWAPYVLIGPVDGIRARPDGKVATTSVKHPKPANSSQGIAHSGG